MSAVVRGAYNLKSKVNRCVIARMIGYLVTIQHQLDKYDVANGTRITYIEFDEYHNTKWSNGVFTIVTNDERKIGLAKKYLHSQICRLVEEEMIRCEIEDVICKKTNIELFIVAVAKDTNTIILECWHDKKQKTAYLHVGRPGFYELGSMANPGMTIMVKGEEYTGFDGKLSILVNEWWYN